VIHYPCGFLLCGVTLTRRQEVTNPTSPDYYKVSQLGRSLSRMLAANFSVSLELRFDVSVRVDTICAVGPCVINRVEAGGRVVHPFPIATDALGNILPNPTLFVQCTEVLEAGSRLRVELRCRPDLFMFESDPVALEEEREREQRGFRDAKGNEYGQR
jgi:hypothetical protein